jgi:DNA-binding beta-propeller fold protein YncE
MTHKTSVWFLLLVVSLLAACGYPPTQEPEEFVWNTTGDPNPLNAPVGIAVDSRGNIYVMDTKNSRIQKFDSNGKFVLMWGSPGSGEGQFSIKVPDEGRLAVDSQGNVYVLDVSNFRLQKFDSNGMFLAQWGTEGKGDGQFSESSDIAIDEQDNVYIVDYRNIVVQKFDKNGTFFLRWGKAGFKDGEFAPISSVAIDPDGNILVADLNGRLQKFDSEGNFLAKIPLEKMSGRSIDTWNIAIDMHGNIFVADHAGRQIVEFNRNGELITSWIGIETGAEPFDQLQDIAVDKQGYIYITDSGSNLVQKFRQTGFHP